MKFTVKRQKNNITKTKFYHLVFSTGPYGCVSASLTWLITHLSFCFSPGLSIRTSVTAFSPLLLPSELFFLFFLLALPLPLMRSAWHAGGWSPSSQELHWWKLRELSVCQLSLPCCSPSLFSSGLTFFFFFFPPLLLESCQPQTPLDGGMQILSLETSQPAS